MQIDMHYYGTYAMARAAGINPKTAEMIATCAQFVDDNVAGKIIRARDGASVDAEATAHHTLDKSNLDFEDQRQVWVPFHFLPGDKGGDFLERLKCRKNSKVAQEMWRDHLRYANRRFAPALMGIAAHVYADTFSHYGFSGISSPENRIIYETLEADESHDEDVRNDFNQKKEAFFEEFQEEMVSAWKSFQDSGDFFDLIPEKYKAAAAEELSGALGHGAVASFPDKPYLKWRFQYEYHDVVATDGKLSDRDNRETFLEGCQALHDMFSAYVQERPEISSEDGLEFDDIRQVVNGVLSVEGHVGARVQAWHDVAMNSSLLGKPEEIPDYKGKEWNDEWANLDGNGAMEDIVHSKVWLFYQAAAVHRTYVLRDLLPRHGLIVG